MTGRNEVESDAQGGSASIKSLGTAFAVVEALKELQGGRVTEIANHTGMSKSTVHKHLNTMVAHEYVVKEDEKYRLGFRFLDIGGYVRSRFSGADIIKPKMQELAEKTDEVAQYMTEENGRTVVLYREEGRNGVPSQTRTGKRMYIHQTASGKAILSQLPRERVDAIVDKHGLPKATESTVTDRESLFEELDAIRERGISYSYGESTKGLYAVATPMSTPDDEVLGALVVSGPSHRMRGAPIEEEIPDLLLSIVNEIELNIAHS